MKLSIVLLGLILSSAFGCSSSSKNYNPEISKPRLSDSDYKDLIEENTKKDEKYDGLHNLYHLNVTVLDSKVNGARLDRIRFYNQLDQEKAAAMRDKSFKNMAKNSQFFISYYSPDKDLRKLPNMWKFYLEHNGLKYEGKIKHLKKRAYEVHVIYPHMDRWSKPYIIEFPIPMAAIEKSNFKFVMTGAAGSSEFIFSPSL